MSDHTENNVQFLSTVWGNVHANSKEAPTGYMLTRLNRIIEAAANDERLLQIKEWPYSETSDVKEAGITRLCKIFGFIDRRDIYWPEYD